MSLISSLYSAIARRRRRWYARHSAARARLARPVISVGNLSVGGSGKTPLVAHLATLLLEMGERPAVLSRGYGRRVRRRVVVVRDAHALRSDLAHAGDEPLMLARALPGVAVVVAARRYEAGRLAEDRLGATVHLLDDGFQHMMLHRSVDLVVVSGADLADAVLPAGRLREPLEAAAAADAIVVPGETADRDRVAERYPGLPVFRAERSIGAPRALTPWGAAADLRPGASVLALAGIARPQSFLDDLAAAGWAIGRVLQYRDHHRYSARDVERIRRAAQRARAAAILTTEKDAIRLLPHAPLPVPLLWLPLAVRVEPAAVFRSWLVARLAAAREASAGSTRASST